MTKKQLVKRSDKTASRIIDGEAVTISLEDTWVRGLNPVATRIWQLLDDKTTVDQIAEVISTEYEVDLATAQEDTQQLLKQLAEKNLVSWVEE